MAANKERGEMALVAGSKTYVMKLTTNAVCEMETLSGRTFDQVAAKLQNGSVSDVRLFLWAMLREHHRSMTLEDVGNVIDGAGGIMGIAQQLTELVNLNTGEVAALGKDQEENPLKAQAGIGANSTLTPDASD